MNPVSRIIAGLFLCCCLLPVAAKAQFTPASPGIANTGNSPVDWQFSIRKMDNGDYRLEARATLSDGFHIWAQDPGGDGSLIPTSFTAESIQNGKWIGDWKETEQPKVQKIEIFGDAAIRWHDRSVTFYRDFKARKGDKIKGSVQYQSCNDRMCLPPAIRNFTVVVE